MVHSLASSSLFFDTKKSKILEQLAQPDDEYSDASPKGSVDVGIRNLIEEINTQPGFVTTSSCAGRVSVFLEGRKAGGASEDGSRQVASIGGKGADGKWLFVSHETLDDDDGKDWAAEFGLTAQPEETLSDDSGERRLIHFKFEPMVRLSRNECRRITLFAEYTSRFCTS